MKGPKGLHIPSFPVDWTYSFAVPLTSDWLILAVVIPFVF